MKPGYKILIIAAILALFTILGYEYGRHKTPAKVVTVTKTVTVDHDVIHTVTQVEKQVVYVQAQAKDVHKVVVIDKKPTGEVVTTTTLQDNTKITTSDTSNKQVEQNKMEDHVVYKDREVTKTVINNVRPNWLFGANGGYNFGDIGSNLIPGLPNKIVVGVSAAKRILGPVYGGVYLNSNEVAGVGLSLEF
jgi:hypothetical protein